jgi:hypothetical protein
MTTKGFGKFCPICKHKNEAGALICEHCGASLEKTPTEPTTTRQVDDQLGISAGFGERIAEELSLPGEGVAVYLYGSTTPIAIRTDREFVIGRAVQGKPAPLVDLSEFDGFAMGVSRQHVTIRPTKAGYDVTDLDSSNGTWLNELRLIPNRPYPLPNRSVLRLGLIRLIVLYQPPGGADK